MVLVVEDEVLIRTMVADVLREEGLAVVEATTADEALVVLCGSIPIGALLTDIRMPGSMDGLELARVARDNSPSLKIVVLSSHMERRPDTEFIDAFLAKPFNLTALADMVVRLMSETRGAV